MGNTTQEIQLVLLFSCVEARRKGFQSNVDDTQVPHKCDNFPKTIMELVEIIDLCSKKCIYLICNFGVKGNLVAFNTVYVVKKKNENNVNWLK